ncbi:hypothetical protein AU476_04115 [Cupriavidus sp. UYMSc13B]|nr:hypothetical protein AU476_04115 [Cupriavidus sp. UYMSc13B]
MGLPESLAHKAFWGNRQILHGKYDYPGAAAIALAARLAQGPRQAMTSIKALCRHARERTFDDQLEAERIAMAVAQGGARPVGTVWTLMAICLLAVPSGVWLGRRLHGKLDPRQMYRACYGLLVVTAMKPLWDGASGYLSWGSTIASAAPGQSPTLRRDCARASGYVQSPAAATAQNGAAALAR